MRIAQYKMVGIEYVFYATVSDHKMTLTAMDPNRLVASDELSPGETSGVFPGMTFDSFEEARDVLTSAGYDCTFDRVIP